MSMASEVNQKSRQLLYVTVDDPWDAWTGSGFGPRLAVELRSRNRLYGATWPGAKSQRELSGPSPWRPLAKKVRRLLKQTRQRPPLEHERDGVVGEVLREMPRGASVMY